MFQGCDAFDSVDERVCALFGEVDWSSASGVLHVAAIHGESNRILAIGPRSPVSPMDRFVLGFTRARADVLVSTGAILRAETGLVHRYGETDAEEAALVAWRADRLGRRQRPSLLMLSESGRFERDHPAFAGGRGWIWTTSVGAEVIGRPPPGFEVVVAEEAGASVERALDFVLRSSPGGTVSIEAGPTVTRSLYASAEGCPVDELLLSRFDGSVHPDAMGPAFAEVGAPLRCLGPARSSRQFDEESGAWTFMRLRR